jgi:hypothetical protein
MYLDFFLAAAAAASVLLLVLLLLLLLVEDPGGGREAYYYYAGLFRRVHLVRRTAMDFQVLLWPIQWCKYLFHDYYSNRTCFV